MRLQLMRRHVAPTSLFFVHDIYKHDPMAKEIGEKNWKIIAFQIIFYVGDMLSEICFMLFMCDSKNSPFVV